MLILVTGGMGYIGSHTCIELIKSGHEVVIADNLVNSSAEVLHHLRTITNREIPFINVNVTDKKKLGSLFEKYEFDGVIHFAGLKSVGDSTKAPLEYYRNNVMGTIALAELCIEHSVNRFIFSSSATVYGDNISPYKEDMDLRPTTNPYGETKVVCERILKDVSKANPNFGVINLRYFNPVGAHESGLIGENPKGVPNNLMPYITQVAKGERERLFIYGNDYNTKDGTGVRDYIHVMDLSRGHVAALNKIGAGEEVYNLGTGKGTTVLELIRTFEEVNGIKIPFSFVGRRSGDVGECYADVKKAANALGWRSEQDLREMVRDAWRFESKKHK